MARKQITVTIAAGGTPIHALTGLNAGAANVNLAKIKLIYPKPVFATRIKAWLQAGSTGPAYILDGIYQANRAPAVANASDLTGPLLSPTTAGQPGVPYEDHIDFGEQPGIDITAIWFDGATGDKITFTWNEAAGDVS